VTRAGDCGILADDDASAATIVQASGWDELSVLMTQPASWSAARLFALPVDAINPP